jgi:hypothetical protein
MGQDRPEVHDPAGVIIQLFFNLLVCLVMRRPDLSLGSANTVRRIAVGVAKGPKSRGQRGLSTPLAPVMRSGGRGAVTGSPVVRKYLI